MTGEFSPNHLYKLLSFVTEGGIVIYNLKLIYVAPAFELSGIKPMLYALSQASLRIFLRLKGSPPPNVGKALCLYYIPRTVRIRLYSHLNRRKGEALGGPQHLL